MSLGIKDYKSVVTLGILKTKIYRFTKDRINLIEACNEAANYLSLCQTSSKEFEGIIEDCYKSVKDLLDYIKNKKNPLEGVEFKQLMLTTLESYSNHLISKGSEVDKVSWLETVISKFIDEFENVDVSKDSDFKFLVKELKDDIHNVYNYTFTNEMQESVTNYNEFLDTIEKLKIGDSEESSVFRSSIFS